MGVLILFLLFSQSIVLYQSEESFRDTFPNLEWFMDNSNKSKNDCIFYQKSVKAFFLYYLKSGLHQIFLLSHPFWDLLFIMNYLLLAATSFFPSVGLLTCNMNYSAASLRWVQTKSVPYDFMDPFWSRNSSNPFSLRSSIILWVLRHLRILMGLR